MAKSWAGVCNCTKMNFVKLWLNSCKHTSYIYDILMVSYNFLKLLPTKWKSSFFKKASGCWLSPLSEADGSRNPAKYDMKSIQQLITALRWPLLIWFQFFVVVSSIVNEVIGKFFFFFMKRLIHANKTLKSTYTLKTQGYLYILCLLMLFLKI